MRYLADTHALIWWLSGSSKLTAAARAVFEDQGSDVYASAASAWEICTKHRIGKLPDVGAIVADVEGAVRRRGFVPLAITMAQAEIAGRMEGAHKDPFDRMLIAQALIENLVLISNETAFDSFGVSRLW